MAAAKASMAQCIVAHMQYQSCNALFLLLGVACKVMEHRTHKGPLWAYPTTVCLLCGLLVEGPTNGLALGPCASIYQRAHSALQQQPLLGVHGARLRG